MPVRPVPFKAGEIFSMFIDFCCQVINQVDTSQGHLSAKPEKKDKEVSKPGDLSKDELTAVLKYGAQKM